jgi:hypothetical protein
MYYMIKDYERLAIGMASKPQLINPRLNTLTPRRRYWYVLRRRLFPSL